MAAHPLTDLKTERWAEAPFHSFERPSRAAAPADGDDADEAGVEDDDEDDEFEDDEDETTDDEDDPEAPTDEA